MAVLEDPHHGPEYGGQAQEIEDERLEREDNTSGEEEQDYEGSQHDQGDGQQKSAVEVVLLVHQLRRGSPHIGGHAGR